MIGAEPKKSLYSLGCVSLPNLKKFPSLAEHQAKKKSFPMAVRIENFGL